MCGLHAPETSWSIATVVPMNCKSVLMNIMAGVFFECLRIFVPCVPATVFVSFLLFLLLVFFLFSMAFEADTTAWVHKVILGGITIFIGQILFFSLRTFLYHGCKFFEEGRTMR